ncbi:MexH family multidrug efflux RND transporter periplasmic adaptor subunit [Spirochaetia bacterium]|nr:MexH family multidrug efflux RND transporter periplasmic adaptor subunit [Spirochaetia bacterium]
MKKLYFLLLALMLLIVSCRKEAAKTVETPVPVKTLKISGDLLNSDMAFSGTIEAGDKSTLSFLNAGRVLEVFVNEGDGVVRGQVLVRIDSSIAQDAQRAAQAKYDQAIDARQRYEPMYKDGNLPEIKWVEILTDVKETKSALDAADKTVDDCVLRAPISGVVSGKKINVGNSCLPGVPVMDIIALGHVDAHIAVPENSIKKISVGQNASVWLADLTSSLSGSVHEISPSADALSRTFSVDVFIENPPSGIRAGMLCKVYIQKDDTQEMEDTAGGLSVVIPSQAINIDASNREYVYVVDTGNRVHRQYITNAGFEENGIVISGGLKMNDIIVVDGTQKLDENMLIQVDAGVNKNE